MFDSDYPLYLQAGERCRIQVAVDVNAATYSTADVTFGECLFDLRCYY